MNNMYDLKNYNQSKQFLKTNIRFQLQLKK